MRDPVLEAHQLRSAGTLDAGQRAYCRKRRIPLAYDPRQIGWVLADCRDDFDDDIASEAPAPDAPRPDLHAQANELFDARAEGLLAGFDPKGGERATVARALWAMPEEVVGRSGPTTSLRASVRRAILLELQNKAARLLASRVVSEQERALFRGRCRSPADRYVLRAWREADLPRYRALLDDPEVWRYLPERYPDPLDDDMARALIELSSETARHEVRAIVRDGELVGQIRLEFGGRHADRNGGDAEISYWLGRRRWRQGIISEVVPLFTLRCFEQRAVRSIFARVAEDNTASSRLLEKSNYRYEGSLRAELDGEPAMKTYRAFRVDYVGDRPATAERRPYSGAVATS